jgi:hypothetical protein
MLRRLPEVHKRKACAMVSVIQTADASTSDPSEKMLHGLPHDVDKRFLQQKWPTRGVVDEWRRLKYVTVRIIANRIAHSPPSPP